MEALRLTAIFLLAGSTAFAAPAIRLEVKGDVQVRTGTGPWQPAASASQLVAGQEVRTAADGVAEITFSDGSKIALAPHSEFQIGSTDKKEASFTLSVGKLRAIFSGIFSSRMSIKTPAAVCAVRGTQFELSASNDGRSEVSVAEGHLEVSDTQGHTAVVTSEESLKIGRLGMEKPTLVSLKDERAQAAARPAAVRMEMANDQTRSMLEDMRNRELKANESQLGKDVIDAFGRRVRVEEYVLRPAANQFEFLFLSKRQERFDWGHVIETFHAAIPNDITQVPAIIAGTFFSANKPGNWLTNFEFFATNTVDSIRETIALGDPILINFNGFVAGIGSLWYPASIDYAQILSGPGVPGGTRTQYFLHSDFGASNPGLFTWNAYAPNALTPLLSAGPANAGTLVQSFTLDPTSAADVAAAGCTVGPCVDKTCPGPGCDPNVNFTTSQSFPSGAGKADLFASTLYADGSTVTSEKILVNNNGSIYDLANPNTVSFNKDGTYNLEIVVGSNLFQGRNIDVVIAPEILAEKKTDSSTPDVLNP